MEYFLIDCLIEDVSTLPDLTHALDTYIFNLDTKEQIKGYLLSKLQNAFFFSQNIFMQDFQLALLENNTHCTNFASDCGFV